MQLKPILIVLLVLLASLSFAETSVCITSPDHPDLVYISKGDRRVEKFRVDPNKHKPLFSSSEKAKFNYALSGKLLRSRGPFALVQKWTGDQLWPEGEEIDYGEWIDNVTGHVIGKNFIATKPGFHHITSEKYFELSVPSFKDFFLLEEHSSSPAITFSKGDLIFNHTKVGTVHFNNCGNR